MPPNNLDERHVGTFYWKPTLSFLLRGIPPDISHTDWTPIVYGSHLCRRHLLHSRVYHVSKLTKASQLQGPLPRPRRNRHRRGGSGCDNRLLFDFLLLIMNQYRCFCSSSVVFDRKLVSENMDRAKLGRRNILNE